MLVKCAALESAYYEVRVNAVAPGVTYTKARVRPDSHAFSEGDNNKFMAEASKDVPLNKEINLPKDVAKSILWLASDDAKFVTGESLVIDGG